MQTVQRAVEARDRNLLEDNLWRVSFWSCASVLVMVCVALTQVNTADTPQSDLLTKGLGLPHLKAYKMFVSHFQVYTVRKLFDDRRRVCT